MKKIRYLILAAFAMAFLCSCVRKVGDLKSVALNDADKSESEILIVEEKTKEGLFDAEYKIEFIADDGKYKYEVSGSGTITEKKFEPNPNGELASLDNGNPTISLKEAKKLAFDHAGVKESEVFLEKAKLDEEDGRLVYEIEFSMGQTEWEYDIDATSGEILKSKKELD